MTGNVTPDDIDRLGKLLGMLGSDHAGERASAGLQADRLLRERGTTWSEIVEGLKQSLSRPRSLLPHRAAAEECLQSGEIWSPKETEFLRNMTWRRKSPSPAQQEWLDRLLAVARGDSA